MNLRPILIFRIVHEMGMKMFGFCGRQIMARICAWSKIIILFNLLIYFINLFHQVALHFLPATSIRCILEPWLREFGFIICYGAIVLKLYRHLVEFRTRKAHRYVVRDLDLLRYLCAMIFAVLCYLAAFTALCSDYLEYSKLIWNFEMENVTTLNMCKPLKWDYVSITFQFLFFYHILVEYNFCQCLSYLLC